MNKTIIIAEAGVNHNGDINIAKKFILYYSTFIVLKIQSFLPECEQFGRFCILRLNDPI